MKSAARLYTQFQPTNYDVVFRIDEDAMRFSGTVTITGKKVGRPSARITLHQHELSITGATIHKLDKKTGETEVPIARINKQEGYNELRLHTEDTLYPGDYRLTIDFEAAITPGMTGIYPCFFKDGNTDKQLIMTQLESHHAREVFPCIDEPEAKAVFTMHLETRTGITVLGNTPVAEQSEKNGRLHTSFEPTPKMSTYLLAFVMGELQRKTTQTNRGTEVNVWATVAQPSESLDFALDASKRCIEYFEDYFGVEYPLPKADHVACPDFSAGAMENWGLITYRERLLLAYPGETAQDTLERIVEVIAHETSHQWFGNLVTMKWWDDLWLNESFADMMEYQCPDALYPEWHTMDDFIADSGLSALRRDAIAGVQSVKVEVHHPDEISALFDPSIVYAKGGRLLYMLKNYIGDEAFRNGLSNYFRIHAYSNTEGADLWAALSEASGKDVAAFMNPWLTRSGFPLVTITQDGANATVEQEQFLDDPTKADKDRLWPVPLFTNAQDQPDAFTTRKRDLILDTDEPMLIGTEGRGHYLVRYATDSQKQAVISMIKDHTLSAVDRMLLLNGSSMQARAGYEPYGNTLRMLDAYIGEHTEQVWGIISLIIGETRRFIDHDATLEDRLKPFVDTLAASQVARLGWEGHEGESNADEKLRPLVLGLAAYADDPAVVQRATDMFRTYKDKQEPLPANLRSLVFVIPVKNGDDGAFDFLLNLHDTTQNGDLKDDALSALTATRDPKKAELLLARLKDPKIVKPQDVDHWLVFLLRNRYTRDVAWDWMAANWDWIEKTFSHDKSYDYYPRYAASCVNTREYQQKYRDLFERNIRLGFEEIEARLRWLERDLGSVQEFFTTDRQ
jgi:aminopeptidase N